MGGFQGKSLDQPSCIRSDDGRVRDVVDAVLKAPPITDPRQAPLQTSA
jgi:hypothetical protein